MYRRLSLIEWGRDLRSAFGLVRSSDSLCYVACSWWCLYRQYTIKTWASQAPVQQGARFIFGASLPSRKLDRALAIVKLGSSLRAKMADGRIAPVLSEQKNSQVVVSRCVLWVDAQGHLIVVNRPARLFLFTERAAHIVNARRRCRDHDSETSDTAKAIAAIRRRECSDASDSTSQARARYNPTNGMQA